MLILDITQYENHINTQAGCSGPHSEEQSPAVRSARRGWGRGPWSSVDERRPGALAWSPRVSPATGGVGAEHICKQTLPSAPVRSTCKGTASASTRQTEVARRDTRPFRSCDWGWGRTAARSRAWPGQAPPHATSDRAGRLQDSPAQPGTARHSAPQNTGGGAELSGQLLSPQEEGRERMRWGPSSPFMGSSYLTPSKNREILCAGEEQNAILINLLHKNADVHRTALCWLRWCYEL